MSAPRQAVYQCPTTRKVIVLQERNTNPPTCIITQGLLQNATPVDAAEYVADLLGGNGVQTTVSNPFDALNEFYAKKMRRLA